MEFKKHQQQMKKHNKTESHRCREQIGGCQRGGGWGRRETGEEEEELQTSRYKITES